MLTTHSLYTHADYACNIVQGESTSLSILDPTPTSQPQATTPSSGGLTRQHGNLSFTRVYQAGRMVPAYQPEAAYKVFVRGVHSKDIATGLVDLDYVGWEGEAGDRTEGPG